MGQPIRRHVPMDSWNSWKLSAYINELVLFDERWVFRLSLKISDAHLRI